MTNVAIIEDQHDIREGLRVLINGTPSFRCTGAFSSMEDALDDIASTQPDIAAVDIGLPGMSGIAGIARLKQAHPRLLILMLTVYDDDRRIFDAVCAGACDYMLKTTARKASREPQRSHGGRRSHVAHYRTTGARSFSSVPPARTRGIRADAS